MAKAKKDYPDRTNTQRQKRFQDRERLRKAVHAGVVPNWRAIRVHAVSGGEARRVMASWLIDNAEAALADATRLASEIVASAVDLPDVSGPQYPERLAVYENEGARSPLRLDKDLRDEEYRKQMVNRIQVGSTRAREPSWRHSFPQISERVSGLCLTARAFLTGLQEANDKVARKVEEQKRTRALAIEAQALPIGIVVVASLPGGVPEGPVPKLLADWSKQLRGGRPVGRFETRDDMLRAARNGGLATGIPVEVGPLAWQEVGDWLDNNNKGRE